MTGWKHEYFTKIVKNFNISIKLAELRTKKCQRILTLRLKVTVYMQVTLHFNASIFSSMQPVPLLVLVPALPVVSLSELSPKLLLTVTATGKETYALRTIIISCHLSRPIGSKISYLQGYYSTIMARGIFRGGPLGHGPPFGSPGLQNCIEKWAKLRHGPPFVSWASGFWLEIWVILGEKTGRNLSEDLFFCSSADFGRKMARNLSVTISNSDLCSSQSFWSFWPPPPPLFKILRMLLSTALGYLIA